MSFAQQPCITEPMKGYIGDCEISVTISPDGKKIYTSDRLSLKIWDVATNKVIDEISPFPHPLWTQSNDPDILRVGFDSNYRISTGAVEKTDWHTLKGVTLPKDAQPGYMQQFTIPELSLVFYRSKKGTLKMVDLNNNGKVTALDSKYTEMFHIPGTKSVLIRRKDGYMHIYNAESRTIIETDKIYPFWLIPAVSIDGRFAVLLSEKVICIFDSQTNTFVFEHPVVRGAEGLHVTFTPDKSRYYIFATKGLQQENDVLYSSIFEFSYPDLKLVRTIDLTKVTFPAQSCFVFNPATEQLVFKQPQHFKTHKDMHIFDIRAWKYNGVFSLEEKGSFNNEEKYAAERAQRIRIGNQALNALYDLPASVSPCHSETPQPTIFTHIDDYTNDGTVIIRDDPDDGGRCIVWKFPEGKPLMLYFSTTYFGDRPSANAVHVPAKIGQSMLSPSGKEVGFNTANGVYIYRGTTLIYQNPGKILKAMLNGKALLCVLEPRPIISEPVPWPYRAQCQKSELIDLVTGKSVQSKAIDSYEGKSDDGNKLFVSFSSSPSPVLKWIEMNDPSKVVTVEDAEAIKKSGFAYRTTKPLSTTIFDQLTRQSEVIPNFRAPKWSTDPKSYVMRDNYILTFEAANGFKLIDINTAKPVTDTKLYAGWTQFKDMAYLKGIGKILVMDNLPIFTRPNAGDEDPGASVFTIDVTTGEITPYLTTISRKTMKANGKAAAAALAYSYTPEGRCSSIPADHRKGHGIMDLKTGKPTGVVMGYDCDEDVYVVAYREAYDASAGIYNIRFMKKTRKELEKDQLSGSASYRLCPACGGYPTSFSKKTTSGWSDWEQKSLNIYVYRREWETKTVNMMHVCQVCKGAAWMK